MKQDVVIDEIRAVRHKISEEFGHNTKALLDHCRALERKYGDRVLRPKEEALSPRSRASD